MKIYTYRNCGTCQKATKWLRAAGIDFEEIPIRDAPPAVTELQAMLETVGGDLRALCNTSGQDYRALGLKDKLPRMAPAAGLELLSSQGNLVKRPFLIDERRGIRLLGFREEIWGEKLLPGGWPPDAKSSV